MSILLMLSIFPYMSVSMYLWRQKESEKVPKVLT